MSLLERLQEEALQSQHMPPALIHLLEGNLLNSAHTGEYKISGTRLRDLCTGYNVLEPVIIRWLKSEGLTVNDNEVENQRREKYIDGIIITWPVPEIK